MLQLIRCLDGMLHATAFGVLLLLHPSIGRNELGNLDVFCTVPIVVIAYFAWRLPNQFRDIAKWPEIVFRVRVFGTCFAGLAPLTLLWMAVPHNSYLLTNSILAVIMAIGLMFHMNLMILELSVFAGNEGIEWESRLTRMLIFYLLLVPYLAVVFTLSLDSFISSRGAVEDYYYLLAIAPWWATLLLLAPLVFFVSLLIRTRLMLVSVFNDENAGASTAPRDHEPSPSGDHSSHSITPASDNTPEPSPPPVAATEEAAPSP